MADEQTPDNAQTPKEGEKAPEKQLIAGKFESQGDLVKAYDEAQRTMHEKAQEAARWKQASEDLLSMQDRAPAGDGKGAEDTPDPTEVAQKLMSDPETFLKERDERVANRVYGNVRKYLDTRDAVQGFLDANPEIKTNAALFAVQVQQTNPRAPLHERLREAAEATITEVQRIRNEGKAAKEFEDKQKQEAHDGGAGGETPPDKPKDEGEKSGDTMEDYMKDRQADRKRMLGIT